MPKDAHNKAAEHHKQAAKSHRVAAEHHGRGDHAAGHEHSGKAHATPRWHTTNLERRTERARRLPKSGNYYFPIRA